MTEFTVEVTTAPVADGDWSTHLRAVDSVPGTFLVEDEEEPLLVFPVTAEDPMKAFRFVEGVAALLDLDIMSGSVDPAPVLDSEIVGWRESEAPEPGVIETEVSAAAAKWVESVHGIKDAPCNGDLVHA